jgi:hypothetical protein
MDFILAEKLLEKELAFFSSESDSEKADLLIEKADLYNSRQEFVFALSELERAENFSYGNNSKLKYKKMLNYFFSNQFNSCASILISRDELKLMDKEKEYFSMRFFSLNEVERWDKCRAELLDYCAFCDSTQIRGIISLKMNYDYVDPEKYKRLSFFVPGLGMARVGKPVKGATSLLLQTGMVVGIAYGFYSGYYVASIVSGVFPLMKFHKGGSRFSAILAEDWNEKEKKKLIGKYAEEIKKVVTH